MPDCRTSIKSVDIKQSNDSPNLNIPDVCKTCDDSSQQIQMENSVFENGNNFNATFVESPPRVKFPSSSRSKITTLLPQRYVRSVSVTTVDESLYTVADLKRIRAGLTHLNLPPKRGYFSSFTRHQVLALVSLCLVDFLAHAALTVLPPFFPEEVRKSPGFQLF